MLVEIFIPRKLRVSTSTSMVLIFSTPTLKMSGTTWTNIQLLTALPIHLWQITEAKDEEGNDLPKTVISREYSSEWKPGDEPCYPVNDEKNSHIYAQYKALADKEENVIFGGRLGEYKYYDMDATVASVLRKCQEEF